MTLTSLYLPGAVWRPIGYRADAGRFTAPPLGYIPHVPVSNGSLFAYFNGLKSPNRKFSTGLIFKDGSSEQYTELTNKPWAQAAGNGQYHAFEMEGYPNEPYTPAQINTLAIWHNFLGTLDRLAEAPGAAGIGTHYMGGALWGGHTCPDPQAGIGPRSRQRGAIIARAQALRTNPTQTQEQIMADLILTNPATKADATAASGLSSIWAYTFLNYKMLTALGVQASVAVDEKALAADLVASLAGPIKDAVSAAVTAGGSPAAIADAVVAHMGAALMRP